MTYQRPAYEEVTIVHDGNTVTLRPSLRAAVTLTDRHGFPALFRGLDEGNFTIISEILAATSPGGQDASGFLAPVPGKPLAPFIMAVRQPLAELVAMLMPAPDPNAKPSTGKLTEWPAYFRELYKIATGWLGWTPETAWNATPTEITEAAAGNYAMLRAIHGSADEQPPFDPSEEISPEQTKAGIATLRENAKRGKK